MPGNTSSGCGERESMESWGPDHTYVIGHQRPDTDSIASAVGYSWMLNQRISQGTLHSEQAPVAVSSWLMSQIGHETVPARAGQPGPQALFALERFGVETPCLLTDAAPTFGHAALEQPYLLPESPLPFAMARVAAGDRVIPIIDAKCCPVGVVTSLALARAYTAPVNMTVMLSQTCGDIAEPAQIFKAKDRISDYRTSLLRSETEDFCVVSETGEYLGIAPRRRLLDPPRARLILVDHNELSQAVMNAEQADIVAVLDHHRLGNAPTAAPILFRVQPVGSTCTLVAMRCKVYRLTPPVAIAGLLLSGILSDTLLFRSPTTTPDDRCMAEWLAELATVDIETYGTELLNASPGLSVRSADETLDTDRKLYAIGDRSLSIAQVEVSDLAEVPQQRQALLEALEQRRQREALNVICLMITDVIHGRSLLLCVGEPRVLASLPFPRLSPGEYDIEEIVSRKKQLVPILNDVLEQVG